MSMVGVIGGSGLYELKGLDALEDRALSTPYGEPSAPYLVGEIADIKVAFLPRHGKRHNFPPHRINYRANIWGFKELGAKRIISVNASGGINTSFKPGEIVLLDQVIDMTQGMRLSTFYDGEEVVHVDFTEPYCPELRKALLGAASRAGIKVKKTGTYICVNGPRLESRAEIKHYDRIGADVIGMTSMPEASLARELEICFSAIAVVTNYAAGLAGKKLTTEEVVKIMGDANDSLKNLLEEALALIPSKRACQCKDALSGARY
jgi:5'-methylthioadenosine phosphorylase